MLRILIIVFSFVLVLSCSTKEKKWGQDFNLEGKWWEQNNQSYDPNTKIFMVAGMSRGNYGSLRLERDSADMDARKQVANFMQTMVSSYVKESTQNNVDASENMVKAVSQEVLVGSAIIARHYSEEQKIYYSLVKIDLRYFFDRIKDRVIDSANKTLVEKYQNLDPDERDRAVGSDVDALRARIQKVEDALSSQIVESQKPAISEI